MAKKVIHTDQMAWVLDPEEPQLGPVEDGGTIIARTSPGCWGPMITPDYASGHEVTKPVAVEGAEPGDAVLLEIERVDVLSTATTSGTDEFVEGSFVGDPFVAKRCPECETINPKTYVKGTGKDAIRCQECDAPVTPFSLAHGYTMVFDGKKRMGVTAGVEAAERIAEQAVEYSALPAASTQYSCNLLAKADLPGVMARVTPMVGNVGSCPAVPMPSSHNAGDFGAFLLDAPHDYGLSEEELASRTDGHMDINEVREGTALLVPVKVEGAGIYIGDVHAMQGDGEIAGHTTDVSAEVEVEVSVLKDVDIDGPIVLPREEDLPREALPHSEEEREVARRTAGKYGFSVEGKALPLQFVGTGADINRAVENGLQRAAAFTGYSMGEVKNRTTITGSVEIGRLPGVVQVTMLVPQDKLAELQLLDVAGDRYGE